jgi:hypothetical protein
MRAQVVGPEFLFCLLASFSLTSARSYFGNAVDHVCAASSGSWVNFAVLTIPKLHASSDFPPLEASARIAAQAVSTSRRVGVGGFEKSSIHDVAFLRYVGTGNGRGVVSLLIARGFPFTCCRGVDMLLFAD